MEEEDNDDFVVLDEELPPLEEKVILSEAELLKENATFIAFNPTEVQEYLQRLVADEDAVYQLRKTSALQSAYEEATTYMKKPIHENPLFVPMVDIGRKPSDNLEDWMTSVCNISRETTSFKAAQDLYAKRTVPYMSLHTVPENEQATTETELLVNKPTRIIFPLPDDDGYQSGMLLASDPIFTKLGTAVQIPVIDSGVAFLHERSLLAKQIQPCNMDLRTLEADDIKDELSQLFESYPMSIGSMLYKCTPGESSPAIMPSLQIALSVIDKLAPSPQDNHTIELLLSTVGIDVNKLDAESAKEFSSWLEKRWGNKRHGHDKGDKADSSPAHTDIGKRTGKKSTRCELLQTLLQRLDTLVIQSPDSSVAALPPSELPHIEEPSSTFHAADLLTYVQEGYQIPDLLEQVSIYLQKLNTKVSSSWDSANRKALLKIQENPLLIKETLAKLTAFELIMNRTVWDKNDNIFVDTYQDVKDVKKGNDVRLYDGDPSNASTLFVADEMGAVMTSSKDAKYNDDETDANNMYSILSTELTSYKLDIGTEEIFLHALRLLKQLSLSSGMELDLATIVPYVAKGYSFPSIVHSLQQKLPTLSEAVIRGVANKIRYAKVAVDLEDYFRQVVQADIEEDIRKVSKAVHQDYHIELQRLVYECLAWWTIELLTQSLSGRLNFSFERCAVSSLSSWSLYGVPVNQDRSKGILPYLANAAVDMFPQAEWAKGSALYVVKMVIDKIQEDEKMKDRVDKLKEVYEQHKKRGKVDAQENAANAWNSMMQVVYSNQKDRYMTEYMNVLRMLPAVFNLDNIPNKDKLQHPRAYMGCCLQSLDGSFVADSDIKKVAKTLVKLKAYFQSNSKLVVKRSGLLTLEKDLNKASTANDSQQPTANKLENQIIVQRLAVPFEYKKWSGTILSTFPTAVESELRQNPSSGYLYAEKGLHVLSRTAGTYDVGFINKFLVHDETSIIDMIALIRRVPIVLKRALDQMKYSEKYIETRLLEDALYESTTLIETVIPRGHWSAEWTPNIKSSLCIFLVRLMCLPSKVDFAGKTPQPQLSVIESVDGRFLSNLAQDMIKEIQTNMKAREIPSMDLLQDTISKLREKQKKRAIDYLNRHNDQDRQILVQMKKLKLASLMNNGDGDEVEGEVDGEGGGEGVMEQRNGVAEINEEAREIEGTDLVPMSEYDVEEADNSNTFDSYNW